VSGLPHPRHVAGALEGGHDAVVIRIAHGHVEEALDFLAYLRLAKRRSVLADLTRGESSLTAFFETEYWPKDAQRNLAPNTRKSYLSAWYAHLKPRLGHLQLRQLTPPDPDVP
jgi:hypothetical protein